MEEGFRLWANPSSPHAEGRKARALLEDARERIKAALGWEGELIFTSGASEAAAIAMTQGEFVHDVASAVEHDAILSGYVEPSSLIPVDDHGAVKSGVLRAILQPSELLAPDRLNRSLAIVQDINSETGNRQPAAKIIETTRAGGNLLLVDCAQSAGKYPLPDCDMAIVSAQKFGGPIGVGALLVADFALLRASGGQERGYRRGTENLPGARGMAAALEACESPYLDPAVLGPLDGFAAEVRAIGGDWLSDRLSDPTPLIRAIAMPGMSGSAQVMRFDMAGISVSQGSACSSGTMKPSRVLEAMGVERDVAERTIRVSLGWNTTRAEVERFCEVWLEMARQTGERPT